MKKFNDLKIRFRISLILGLVFVIILSIMGVYSYTLNKNRRIEATKTLMNDELLNMGGLINTQIADNHKRLDFAMKVAEKQFYFGNYKKIDPIFSNIIIRNKNNLKTNFGKVKINGKTVNANFDVVENIKNLTGADATIFQKCPEGYLRIATTFKDEYGKPIINTYLRSNAEIIQTFERGKSYIDNIKFSGNYYLAKYKPIIINNKVQGLLFVGVQGVDLKEIKKSLMQKSYYGDGYPFLISHSGELLIHPTIEGENISDLPYYKDIINSNKHTGSLSYIFPNNENGKKKVLYYNYIEDIDSYLAIIYDFDTWNEYLEKVKYSTIITVTLGIVLLIIVLLLVLKNVIISIQKGVDFAGKVADGDLTAILDINQQDEIGMLGSSLNRMVLKLQEIVEGVNTGVRNIASASQQMNSGSQQLSQGASEQASSVEEVSSSMEEMVSNIQQNADNAKETEKISNESLKGITEVTKMAKESLESIRKISDKIGIINDIAFQTNILALNAAVEAARAGEHGKGFAVVAAEVRKLAERSKTAAEEIVDITKMSVKLTENSSELMEKVVPDIAKTTNLVQEITGASMEQKSGSDQINNAIQQLNQVTQQNAASSEELATSSEELSSQAETLKEQISYFKIENNLSSGISKSNLKNPKINKTIIEKAEQTNNIDKINSNGVELEMYEKYNNSDDEFEKF